MMKAVENDKNELLVWPWKGIVANIPVQLKEGRYVGESGSKFRNELIERGYNPIRVRPLWNYTGHTGYAVVEFKDDWNGFSHALMFEKDYETIGQGKHHYIKDEEKGDRLYCWVARRDDFYSRNVIGEHLRSTSELKTIAELQKFEEIINGRLVASLLNQVSAQEMRLKEMENMCKDTSVSLNTLIIEKDEMLTTFNEEREKRHKNAQNNLKKMLEERDTMKKGLEMKRRKLNQQEEELKKRQAQNENETLKLANLRNKLVQNGKALEEQLRVDERVLKLADDHRKEKENLHRRTVELEKKLDAKQALEVEIKRLMGKMKVVNHMADDGDASVPPKLRAINQELKDKEKELEYLDALNQSLIVKERICNDELQDVRKELVDIFRELNPRSHIIVKRMGELDSTAFIPAAKRKCLGDDIEVKDFELRTQWDKYLRDANWHPFQVVTVDGGKNYKTIIDEEDEKLKKLNNGLGKEAYEAVINALMEMNEYNPSGRYIVPVLWNKTFQRKATLGEGIAVLLEKWSTLKRDA